jgi:hypothetical protein
MLVRILSLAAAVSGDNTPYPVPGTFTLCEAVGI